MSLWYVDNFNKIFERGKTDVWRQFHNWSVAFRWLKRNEDLVIRLWALSWREHQGQIGGWSGILGRWNLVSRAYGVWWQDWWRGNWEGEIPTGRVSGQQQALQRMSAPRLLYSDVISGTKGKWKKQVMVSIKNSNHYQPPLSTTTTNRDLLKDYIVIILSFIKY